MIARRRALGDARSAGGFGFVGSFGIVVALALGLYALVVFGAEPVSARSAGISGYSGNPTTGAGMCAQCHSANDPTPTVSISGPDTVAAGETALFSVTVSGGPAAVAGFNVSSTRSVGALAPVDTSVRMDNGELTHVTPKGMLNASATFDFSWTAPTTSATLQLWAAGVSANGNGVNSGDSAAATNMVVTVVGETPEVAVATTCVDGVGELSFGFVNPFADIVSYDIELDGVFDSAVTLFPDEAFTSTVGDVSDGDRQVRVIREGLSILDQTVTVDCAEPPPAAPVPGANTSIEVAHVVSCLGGNGRVDTNIVNTGVDTATYRIEFQGLSARQTAVTAGDWWRMPITGRPDADYVVRVLRAGTQVSTQVVTVSCDTAPPVIGDDEFQVVNSCRAGNGYLLFQFLNASDASKGYVIEFEGVPNRSTSAAAFGQTVRAVTGRPDGIWQVKIRSGFDTIASFDVTVSCD